MAPEAKQDCCDVEEERCREERVPHAHRGLGNFPIFRIKWCIVLQSAWHLTCSRAQFWGVSVRQPGPAST